MRLSLLAALLCCLTPLAVQGEDPQAPAQGPILPPVSERFKDAKVQETPDFQKHVGNLLGRLGCNSRACHGSFQGQGGFRLSLFGYDFAADHEAMTQGDKPRVNLASPDESLIVVKPTDENVHEGGLRYEKGSWQHHLLRRWIEGGAKFDPQGVQQLVALEITPAELNFTKAGESVQLRAVARWPDGTREDVTPLCRFTTNNEQVAAVNDSGVVSSKEPGDTHVIVSYDNAVVPVQVIRPVTQQLGSNYPNVPQPTEVDRLVVQKLKKLGIVPSELADDAEFLRRVRLDMTGTLPTASEVEAFLADGSPDKRARKIEELLETPEYAAWWTTKLCDLTGNNDGQLNNVGPVRGRPSRDWYDWIYHRVAANMPYDQLAEGIVLATSRNKDESYAEYSAAMSAIYAPGSEAKFAERDCMPYYWARRNFIRPEDRAVGFAYTFLGIRIQCAQCHKHPFDQWTKSDFEQFMGFFTRVSAAAGNNRNAVAPDAREAYDKMLADLGLDMRKPNNEVQKQISELLAEKKTIPFAEVFAVPPVKKPEGRRNDRPENRRQVGPAATEAKILGGEKYDLTEFADARKPLMDWLRSPNNPYFARAWVNRVWASYFNVGIVQPPDDLSLGNPPSNKPLLDYLTEGFIASGYDMKWVHRTIANSRTYQLTWRPNETNRWDEKNFSRAIPRRLPAEVVADALQAATLGDDSVETWRHNVSARAIGVPGVPPGNGSGSRTLSIYALTIFGRSIRESNCDCDRSVDASLLQTVYIQNDAEVQGYIDRADGWLAQMGRQVKPRSAPAVRAEADRPNRDDDRGVGPAEVQARIERLEARLKQLRKDGNAAEAAALERRLKEFKSRFEDRLAADAKRGADKPAAAAPAAKPDESQPAPFDRVAAIRQAYLRTLSRPPSEAEIARSLAFVEDSSDTLAGLRGLLWALINTKEFVVNH